MRIRANLKNFWLTLLSFVLLPGIGLGQDDKISAENPFNSDSVTDTIPKTEDKILKQIATGYLNQQKADITGSVSIIDPAELTAIPSGNVTNQLQGRASGVTVTGSGQPGMTSKIRIRGFSSFENNDPLYIVDGVPTQDISFLNPEDVESLCVLKDAGSASVYGSRASNGVIVITTKNGSKGIKVTYDMYFGTQSPGAGTLNDVLNAREYADLQWLVYENDGTVETHPIYGHSSNPEPTMPYWAANTDWYDEITNPALIMNHDFTVSGGNDNARFYAGFGYFKQDGIIIYTNQIKYNARFNSEFSFLNKRLKFGENLNMTYRKNLGVSNLNEGSPIQIGPYRAQSIVPVIWTQPGYQGLSHYFVPDDWGGTGIAPRLGNNSNIVADLAGRKDNTYWNMDMIGSAYLDLKIFKGLNFRSTFGGTWYNGYGNSYKRATYENSENSLTPTLTENAYYGGQWVWTNTLTFDKTFGDHRILAIGGYEAVKYGMGRDMSATKADFFSDDPNYRTLSTGAKMQGMGSNYYTHVRLLSFFMKVDYVFNNKYFLGATIRRDGCSLYSENNRFGTFPSVSAGWRISNESFFKGIGWINALKIRGSYGIMGNQFAVSPQSAHLLFKGDVASSYYDLNGTGNSSVTGFYPKQMANPDIKWETNNTLNVGFESLLWQNRLGIVVDWYHKRTDDLLYKPVSVWGLPGTFGETEPPYVNAASMKNSGIDLELTFNDTWGDLGLNSSLIFTTYKNEIAGMSDGNEYFDTGSSRIGAFARNMVGHPVSAFYGYKVLGLFQNTSEIEKAPDQDGAEPGFFRFADLFEEGSGDYQDITPLDRTFIGDPNPKFTYGFNLGLTFKKFDFTAFFYGSSGNDILNYNRWWTDFWASFPGQKSKDLLNNSWTPGNTGTLVPKASNKSNFSTNTQICSYYIEDGSYLRLKNLQIGFTLPEKYLGKTGIKSLRFYIQGINLFTITGYSGLDPEIGGSDTCFGVDAGNYPNAKQFLIGLNLGL